MPELLQPEILQPEVLRLVGLKKSFGAVIVANDLSFGLSAGEALGVIGPNGAGKTSMFNLITGAIKPDSGKVIFDGEDITQLSIARRARSGVARSFQVPQPFSGLTVFENAMVAATQAANLRGSQARHYCLEKLEQTQLLHKANVQAGGLTLLERKRLELTRALCAKPRLLLLDEIAGGLTEKECISLIETVKSIHRSGVAIVWIEHVVHALIAVVDRLIVLNFGSKIAEGEASSIMQSAAVQEIYLGIEANA